MFRDGNSSTYITKIPFCGRFLLHIRYNMNQVPFQFILSPYVHITYEYDADMTIKLLTVAPRKIQETVYIACCIKLCKDLWKTKLG